MDETTFWRIVGDAKAQAGEDLEQRSDALAQELEKYSTAEIHEFQRQLDMTMNRACRWTLWGAAYLMNGGCSDDGFHYFREWLISEGQQTFEAALADPDSLASVAELDDYELESFGYAAQQVLDARGVDDSEREHIPLQGTPGGDPWEEEDLPEMFPRLAKRFDS